MEPSELIGLVLLALVVARPTFRALTSGRPDRVAAWAAAQGLDLPPSEHGVLATGLRRRGRWRAAGALAGLAFAVFAPEFAVRVYRDARPGGNIGFVGFWAVPLGYLVGVLAGELAGSRATASGTRLASLSPRELDEYVPPVARRWLVAGAFGAVAAGTALLLLPMHDRATAGVVVVAAVPPVVAAAVALAAPGLARTVLHRAQRLGAPEALAVDDALRSAGARAVVAAGVAIVYSSLAVELFALTLTDLPVLRWTAWVPALLALGFGVGAWRALVHPGSWRVRRRPTLREQPA